VPLQTAYKSFKHERRWGDWLTLPVTYNALPLTAQLAITVWDLCPTGGDGAQGHSIPFGGTTFPLFDKDNTLQKGRQVCHLHRHKAADGLAATSTPATLPVRRIGKNGKTDGGAVDKEQEESERLEKLLKKHEMEEIPRIEWLDQLVFRSIEKRNLIGTSTSAKTLHMGGSRRENEVTTLDGGQEKKAIEEDVVDEKFTLHIELPRFDFPVVFCDHEYPPPPISSMQNSSQNAILKPPPVVYFGPGINGGEDDGGFGGRIVRIYDPEVGSRDNPAETKHRRLVRGHRTGAMDRDLRPNARFRDELNNIMSYSPTHALTSDEKDLVWKFRHHLTRDKRALTKFVKSVNWQDHSEARQAVQLLSKWTEIDVDDALELLGPTFDNPAVRAYAVDRLGKSDDDELLLYLLQLVQALKFEHNSSDSLKEPTTNSSLSRFLIARATQSFMLGNYFHWYLMVECDDKSPGQPPEYRKLFAKVEYDFMMELEKTPGGRESRKTLLRQAEFIAVISKISLETSIKSGSTIAKKAERAKHFLADPKNELLSIDPPLPLPLDPSILVTGVYPEETAVFKSSLSPLKITFRTSAGRHYPIIFKTGDDLRQDQLVIQIIMLMDQLLRKENLDLKLSPYKILATGATAGAVQFVPSSSLAAISTKYRSGGPTPILNYLRTHNPDARAPLGVRKEAMDTYVKSCAGYCVITYLLGVGDRHLDNLLLAPSGHFFHADFGYILGRDPKPFAPLMKLGSEMADGMGGQQSENWARFKEYAFTAYAALRKQSGLVLNLFGLMVDANIPDIRIEPERVVEKVMERFMLGMSEEEAIRGFERVIEDSVGAIFPVVIDRLHGIVQHFRT
jgi:phosphatidylinositol 3-kinase